MATRIEIKKKTVADMGIKDQGSPPSQQDNNQAKGARFVSRKQRRTKRHRSDGFMLSLEVGANSSDEEGFINGPLLGDAVNFLQWIRNPSLQNLAKLRRAIKKNDKDWMTEFLEFDGLGLLFQCLKDLSQVQGYHMSDMVLKMECVMCIREVVNSQTGLDCLLQIKGRKDNIFGRRFASALETKNLMVKIQIFELLSALCVYSKDGYYLTLDALERYKSWQKLQYRMSLLVNEIQKSELTTYKTTIMALINAIIFANENIKDRIRIRNEFIALNILDTILTMKCADDDELLVQCDVFEDEFHADTEALEEINTGVVNLNDPQSVFNSIFKKVQGTPLCATLLGILHSLLQIETHTTKSESAWILIERLTQEALSNDSNKDGALLIEQVKKCAQNFRDKEIQTDMYEASTTTKLSQTVPATTVPTAPPLLLIPPPPPIPPPLPSGLLDLSKRAEKGGISSPPRLVSAQVVPPKSPHIPPTTGPRLPPPLGCGPPPPPGCGPPPPSSLIHDVQSPPGDIGPAQPTEPLPKPIETPVPSKKMKTLTWNKIPAYAFNKESVWCQLLNMTDKIKVEYDKLEENFSQKETPRLSKDTLSPHSVGSDNNSLIRRNSQQNVEVTLLDPKKSMNLNIFLKQFRKPNDAIITLIKNGDARALGVEKLKGLFKQLPQHDEIEMIQVYEGEVEKLGNAEAFFYELIKVPDFKIRIEMMLLKGDFYSQLGTIRQNIQVLNNVCRALTQSESLKIFLRLVLQAGNFLNKGSSSGDALGFRIGSINKLLMTKSNTPKMTLLHHLVQQANANNNESLKFVEELLELLHKASRFTLECMLSEFTTLKSNVTRLKGQLQNAVEEVKSQFSKFMEEAESDLHDVDESIERVQVLSNKLALHYCENVKTFKLDEFLEAFREFCENVKSCEQELETWKIDEQKAEMRKKSQAELAEKRRSAGKPLLVHKEPDDRKIVDDIVNEIRKGKVLRRLSMKQKTGSVIITSGKVNTRL